MALKSFTIFTFFCWSRMYSSIISLRIFLKVHQCRFENLPICLCSYIKKYPEKFAFLILKVLVRVSQNVKFVLKFTSRRIWLIFGQRIHWKASKSFLSWLCQYLLFSINRCFLNIFFNRLKVCGYPTLLISWFISFMWNLRHIIFMARRRYSQLSLTRKISAIWLAERSTLLAVFLLCFQYVYSLTK